MPSMNGSNAWTVSGLNKKPRSRIYANDPHLALRNPNIWYMNHLYCPEMHVTGVSAPCLPMVQIGHNEKIGWGITLAFTDIEDVFVEKIYETKITTYMHEGNLKETEIIEEKIFIKDENLPHIEKVFRTIHGTIISDIIGNSNQKLSLSSMALTQENLFMVGFFKQAQNWNDFVNGVENITFGLNIVYADVDGNIGYYNSGKVPVRTKQQASVPQEGWSGNNDWKAFVSFDEMPHVLNPEKGYVVTANHKIEPDDFPYF
ncbi:MAG: penicillin acylase family protein [Saprospirales bacterium]|nr:penicillin acylase family protein [Saprospirales bacterium]